jgi:hypothetical protein
VPALAAVTALAVAAAVLSFVFPPGAGGRGPSGDGLPVGRDLRIDGDTCSCSPTTGVLAPGDTDSYYSVFTGVPESAEELSVQIPGAGLFADVPISS